MLGMDASRHTASKTNISPYHIKHRSVITDMRTFTFRSLQVSQALCSRVAFEFPEDGIDKALPSTLALAREASESGTRWVVTGLGVGTEAGAGAGAGAATAAWRA